MNLDQLAERLGLSKTTVSRALAGYPDVSARTRERVQAAAKTHGYQPNPLAQRLRSGRLDTVGLIVPSDLKPVGDAFFVDQVTNISRRLADYGLDLLLSAADPGDKELAALARLVDGRRVDAMIVVRTQRQDPRVDYLLDKGVPFVCHGRTENAVGYAYVDMDGEASTRLATEQLIERGHQVIAFIGLPSSRLTFAWHRKNGYLRALEEAGLAVDPALVRQGDGGKAFGERAAKRLLDLQPRPSAMVCGSDLEAIGALHAIADKGLVAGRDIAVIGHDDLPEAVLTRPPLATMRQPHAAVGVRLAEIVAALIAGGDALSFQEIWPPEFVPRESFGHSLQAA
ncbi:MAG: substrate-binding domain-containing protein [Alphaproteobacteria bacterium]